MFYQLISMIQATSDIQQMLFDVLLIIVSILPIATILKLLVFKSYSYWTTFLIIEGWKNSIVLGKIDNLDQKYALSFLGIGLVNSLSILQFFYIFEIELVTLSLLSDCQQFVITITFAVSHNVGLFYEYYQVGQK